MANTETLPRSVWEGAFTLFGVSLKRYVLDDGRRIVDGDDLAKIFIADKAGVEVGAQQEAFTAWLTGGDK